MLNKILSIITVVAVALGMTSCNDDNWGSNLQRTGTVSLSSMGIDVNNDASRANDIDVSNYIVEISQGGELVGSAYKFASMPEVLTLPVGTYTVTVKSHNVQKAEWDNPYYIGSENFTIVENQICEIGTVRCYFSNVKVTIMYDPELLAVMNNDCKVTVVVNDEGSLEFAKGETRHGFFEAIDGSTTMVAIFDGTVDGNKRNMKKTYTDVKPGQHYTITYSLKNGDNTLPDDPDPENTGNVDPGEDGDDSGISISTLLSSDITDDVSGNIEADDTNEVVIDPGDKPGTEEPDDDDPGNDPVDPGTDPGNDPGEAITITSETLTFDAPVLVTDDLVAAMDIHSDEGIANFVVSIDSDNDNFKSAVEGMLGLSFDLANPGKLESTLRDDLGFPVSDEVIGAHDLKFDISGFMPILGAFKGNHQFTLSITDAMGNNLTKVLTLKVVQET